MDEDLVMIREPGGDHCLKRAAWGRVLQAWRKSGLRANDFARQHKINIKRFFRWQARLRGAAPDQPPPAAAFVELAACVPAAMAGCGDAPLELRLGAARVLVRDGCSADLLRMLIGVVREAAC